jgi:phage regulator Rha-like protein
MPILGPYPGIPFSLIYVKAWNKKEEIRQKKRKRRGKRNKRKKTKQKKQELPKVLNCASR